MKTVVVYETTDGQRHSTVAEAEAHQRRVDLIKRFDSEVWYRGISSDTVVEWFLDTFDLKEKKK